MDSTIDKRAVVDTNVLISTPDFFEKYYGEVYIPICCIEESDGLKNSSDSAVASAARLVSRTIEDGMQSVDNVEDGFKVGNCIVYILPVDENTDAHVLKYGLDPSIVDNRIIGCAMDLQTWGWGDECADDDYADGSDVILLSNDLNVRIKARVCGVDSAAYDEKAITSPKALFDPARVFKNVDIDHVGLVKSGQPLNFVDYGELMTGEYVILESGEQNQNDKSKISALAVAINDKTLVAADRIKSVYGIAPRNAQQMFALDALNDKSVEGVSLIGPAGTGKTLLALASGFDQVMEKKRYNKVLVAKAPIAVGSDLGFLPGTLREKLEPWMGAIFDNVDVLHKNAVSSMKNKQGVEMLESMGVIEFISIAHLRGRSISDAFIIIDEAQNLTPHEVKTILTRLNDNCKVVLLGDPEQIEAHRLTKWTNGLTVATNVLRSNPESRKIFRSIVLTASQRNSLARLSTQLL